MHQVKQSYSCVEYVANRQNNKTSVRWPILAAIGLEPLTCEL